MAKPFENTSIFQGVREFVDGQGNQFRHVRLDGSVYVRVEGTYLRLGYERWGTSMRELAAEFEEVARMNDDDDESDD